MLNNREIAILIWLLIAFIGMMIVPSIRKPLFGVFRAATQKYVLITFASILVYFVFVILCLNQFSFWKWTYLKDMVIWLILDGVVSGLTAVSLEADHTFYKKLLFDNFKLVVLPMFLLNIFVFPLVVELLLIPFVILLGGLLVVSKNDKKNKPAHDFFIVIEVIVVVAVVVYSAINAISDFNIIGNMDTLISFLTPIVLTLFFIPFLFLLNIWTAYSQLFIYLKLNKKASKQLKNKAKRLMFRRYKLRRMELIYDSPKYKISLETMYDEADVQEIENRVIEDTQAK